MGSSIPGRCAQKGERSARAPGLFPGYSAYWFPRPNVSHLTGRKPKHRQASFALLPSLCSSRSMYFFLLSGETDCCQVRSNRGFPNRETSLDSVVRASQYQTSSNIIAWHFALLHVCTFLQIQMWSAAGGRRLSGPDWYDERAPYSILFSAMCIAALCVIQRPFFAVGGPHVVAPIVPKTGRRNGRQDSFTPVHAGGQN